MKSTTKRLLIGPLLVLVAAFGLSLTSCADDSGGGNGNGDTTGTDVSGDGAGDTSINTDTAGCETANDPGGDADGDGISNGLEDKNLNCIQDDGETDWMNPDSDGDGLSDGEEDLNGNGVYDEGTGEFDPLNTDTDGDGIPDNQENSAVICTPDVLQTVVSRPAQFANSNLALPPSFEITQEQDAGGATFSDPAQNSYGWLVSIPATGQNAEAENNLAVQTVATTSGNVILPEFTQPYEIPSTAWERPDKLPLPVPATTGVRANLKATYGPGSPNESVTTKDPAVLRDEILSALGGATVSSGEAGTTCDDLTIYWVSQLRSGEGRFVVAGMVTCTPDFDANEATQFVFEDLQSGTILAPGSYLPEDFLCEEIEPKEAGGVVDFLWVIDNSGSMADEQDNVAATVDEFLAQLATAGVDWRLGVTTSEAYLIPDVNDVGGRAFGNGPDEKIDLQSGLRAPGFIALDNPDAANLFTENVTFDEGCDRSEIPGAQVGDNICGNGLEQPLESGWVVLDQLANETRPEHSLREDAVTIVIWIADEETHAVKDGSTPLPQDDPAFVAHVTEAIDRYQGHEAIGFAIVGDDGIGNGGACELLDTSDLSAVDGAEPGNTYRQVASATGGASGSICNEDLSGTIEAIIAAAIGVAASYELKGYPISPSIKVAVDGQEVQRSHTDGWNYNPVENAIVFLGPNRPGAESEIAVSYVMWKQSGDATP